MNSVLNVVAAFGEVSVFFQAVVSIVCALLMVIVGVTLLRNSVNTTNTLTDAKVMTCGDGPGVIQIMYFVNGLEYQTSIASARSYTPGDIITIRVDPNDPRKVTENIPFGRYGIGFVVCAGLLVVLAYFSTKLVSERKNIAGAAGVASIISAIAA